MFFSRRYLLGVVLLWTVTMGWLVKEKIAPAFLTGTPPRYADIVEGHRRYPLVGWRIQWDNKNDAKRNIGWALTTTEVTSEDLTEIKHVVQFNELPINEMFPLVAHFVKNEPALTKLRLRVETSLLFDPLKRLSSFQTRVKIPGSNDPLAVARGNLDKGQLQFSLQAGSFIYETEAPFEGKSILSDSFSPQAVLPNLREGQKWTVEIYSPFPTPQQSTSQIPLEVIQAKVEDRELIFWQNRPRLCWVVVYRNDPSRSVQPQGGVRGRMWVEEGGQVLKQEATLGPGAIVLVRMSDEEAERLAKKHNSSTGS